MTYTSYEDEIKLKLAVWERELMKRPGMLQNISQSVQTKINQILPEKAHQTITTAVKGVVHTALFTAEYTPKNAPSSGDSLKDCDDKAEQVRSFYKKLAAAEGAGTGAGGIMLALADFPLLIGIKMKFLFELAHVYGYSTKDIRERLFILYVFQLAFSSLDKKRELLPKLKNWEAIASTIPKDERFQQQVNWRELQQEYRDTIDFRKMLQLIPGIGAIIGAWANYDLLDDLGEAGINAYRLRRLTEL